MDWKGLLEQENAKIYVLPKGWDAKDTIVEQLSISDDSVRRTMAPLIKAGTVESGVFPVWDQITKRINRVVAYRRT